MFREGDIGVCGIAVLVNFSWGISVILILNCVIAVFSKTCGMRYSFSVHSRGETYKVKSVRSVDEAISFVCQCKDMLNATTADIG